MASELNVTRAIRPVAATARAHNALVNLIKTMQGMGGVVITVSDGKIIIDGTGITTNAAAEGTAVEVFASPYGKLIKVQQHSTEAGAGLYPEKLRCEQAANLSFGEYTWGGFGVESTSDGSYCIGNYINGMKSFNGTSQDYAVMNMDGVITVHDYSAGKSVTISPGALTANISIAADGIRITNGTSNVALHSGGFYFHDGSNVAEMTAAALTKDVTLREIDVCDGNVAKKMLVFGSAPY